MSQVNTGDHNKKKCAHIHYDLILKFPMTHTKYQTAHYQISVHEH